MAGSDLRFVFSDSHGKISAHQKVDYRDAFQACHFFMAAGRKSLAGNDDGISRRGTLIGLSSFIDYFDSASVLRASRSRSTRGVSAWSTAHWG